VDGTDRTGRRRRVRAVTWIPRRVRIAPVGTRWLGVPVPSAGASVPRVAPSLGEHRITSACSRSWTPRTTRAACATGSRTTSTTGPRRPRGRGLGRSPRRGATDVRPGGDRMAEVGLVGIGVGATVGPGWKTNTGPGSPSTVQARFPRAGSRRHSASRVSPGCVDRPGRNRHPSTDRQTTHQPAGRPRPRGGGPPARPAAARAGARGRRSHTPRTGSRTARDTSPPSRSSTADPRPTRCRPDAGPMPGSVPGWRHVRRGPCQRHPCRQRRPRSRAGLASP
jgi:hypothetical protein